MPVLIIRLLIRELDKLHLEGLAFEVEEKSVNAISSIKVTISSESSPGTSHPAEHLTDPGTE